MSLINDMLRNLEASRPDDPVRQNLQREIRSLPAAKPAGGWGGRLLLLVLLMAIGAAVFYAYRFVPLVPPAPEAVVAAQPPSPPVPVPEPPLPAASTPGPETEKLHLTAELAALPAPAMPVLAVPDPAVPTLPVKAEPDLKKSEADVPRVAPTGNAGPVKIEKSPSVQTPRDRAEAELRKAEAAIVAGHSSEALELLRSALKQDPSYIQARQALLRQLLDGGKADEAIAVLHDGLELQPAQTGWAISLARLQLEQGDVAAADHTLARSQVYAESNADYAGFQGHLKTRLGAYRLAIGHYQRATRLAANDGRWWLGLGLAYEADGRSPEAKEALRRALASNTLSAELAAVAEQHLR